MTIRTSVFIAASLDGYIAAADGGIDWLLQSAPPEEAHGYDEFIASIDVIVMGRATYDTARSFGAWPYDQLRVVVLSRTLTDADIPPDLRATVRVHPGPIDASLLEELAASGATHAYVDGGQVIQGFLRADLLDDMVVTRIPVLLGSGIPLFGALTEPVWWTHEGTVTFPSGLVSSTYRRKRGRMP
jgi:dihydrofolate reductase